MGHHSGWWDDGWAGARPRATLGARLVMWAAWRAVLVWPTLVSSLVFFFNDTATTEIYTLSLHDALPIYHPFLNREPLEPSVPKQKNIGATHF